MYATSLPSIYKFQIYAILRTTVLSCPDQYKSHLINSKSVRDIYSFVSGGPFDVMSRRVLCTSTQALAQKLVPLLEQYYPERD
jgi:hypothetical protein